MITVRHVSKVTKRVWGKSENAGKHVSLMERFSEDKIARYQSAFQDLDCKDDIIKFLQNGFSDLSAEKNCLIQSYLEFYYLLYNEDVIEDINKDFQPLDGVYWKSGESCYNGILNKFFLFKEVSDSLKALFGKEAQAVSNLYKKGYTDCKDSSGRNQLNFQLMINDIIYADQYQFNDKNQDKFNKVISNLKLFFNEELWKGKEHKREPALAVFAQIHVSDHELVYERNFEGQVRDFWGQCCSRISLQITT